MGVCFGVGEIVPKKIKELESKVAKLEEELKAYRDAEEQGLLLRLPCKVGALCVELVQNGGKADLKLRVKALCRLVKKQNIGRC